MRTHALTAATTALLIAFIGAPNGFGWFAIAAVTTTIAAVALRQQARAEHARDGALDNELNWHAAAHLAETAANKWRTRCAEVTAERDHARHTIAALALHHERRSEPVELRLVEGVRR
jgi:hypothetical protein